ncbi:MAG TPA: helix-turn-helix domain-containing protein, partial [Gaiellaceae bacterium]|nr:helix-turn-helix domain-containing protein [Gaiellaceae bacterium]
MFEIGNSLREARVRQGLEYPQVELATKIRGKYIRALEDEQYGVLPAQPYVKGFLRTYAEFLGLDGQLYVDEYNSRFVTDGFDDVSPRRISPRV